MLCSVYKLILDEIILCIITILTKWISSTRLETRTKESNIYASIWVENLNA